MSNDNNLKNKTRKGLFWSTFNTFFNKGLTFLFGIILARLLTPADYGTIGILAIFITIISIFVDSGFSVALIRKEEKKPEDYDTQFYFNIGIGFVCYLILFIFAPYIANFYELPILCPLLRVLAIKIIIQSFGIVQTAIYSINLDFKTPAIIAITANICTGIVGIYMAYTGFEVWSLVAQQLLSQLIIVGAYWILSKWSPQLRFSKDSFRYLFGFGSKILGTSLIQTVYNNIYPLVIGGKFGAGDLGLYSRANHFAQLPSEHISMVLNRVSFPVLSSINNDRNRVISLYTRMLKLTAFVVFPLMVFLAAISYPLIELLLGHKWISSAPMLQILCLALMWQPISAINQSILKVLNRPDLLLKMEFIKRPLGICIIIASLYFGMIGVCVGTVLIFLLAFVVDNICASIAMGVSKLRPFRQLLPYIVMSVCLGAIIFALNSVFGDNILKLLFSSLLFLTIFLVISKLVFKETLEELYNFVILKKTIN